MEKLRIPALLSQRWIACRPAECIITQHQLHRRRTIGGTVHNSYFRTNMETAVWGPLNMDSTTFSTSDVVADGAYAMGVTTHWPDNPGRRLS